MAGPISTPCVALCTIDRETGLCIGCARTPMEIGNWLTYDEEKRLRIMAELPARREKKESVPPDEVRS